VGKNVYYASAGLLGCLSVAKGALIWEADVFYRKKLDFEQSCLSTSSDGHTVFIGCCQHVVAYRAEDGAVLWSTFFDRMKSVMPCVFPSTDLGVCYVAAQGRLAACDINTGEIDERFEPHLVSQGDDICSMASPNMSINEWSECNRAPQAQASSITKSSIVTNLLTSKPFSLRGWKAIKSRDTHTPYIALLCNLYEGGRQEP